MRNKVIVSIPMHCKPELIQSALLTMGIPSVLYDQDVDVNLSEEGLLLVQGPSLRVTGSAADLLIRVANSEYHNLVKRNFPEILDTYTLLGWEQYSRQTQISGPMTDVVTSNVNECPSLAIYAFLMREHFYYKGRVSRNLT